MVPIIQGAGITGTSGTVDTTYASAGIMALDWGADSQMESSLILNAGSVLISGYAYSNNQSDFFMAKVQPQGGLDTTFGSSGVARIDFNSGDDFAHSQFQDLQGNFVLAGSATTGGSSQIALARLTSAGILDFSFGAFGKVVTAAGTTSSEARCVIVDPSGLIVTFGSSLSGGVTSLTLTRYLANGSLDTTFGTGGILTKSLGAGPDVILSCAQQPDGKLVAVGYSTQNGQEDVILLRFLLNGNLDTAFANAGVFLLDIQSQSQDRLYSVALQPDGKIVAGGYTQSSQSDFLILRLNIDGTLDNSFGTGGKAVFSLGAGPNEIRSLALQSNGSILATGFLTLGAETEIATARLLANGLLDSSFGTNGQSLVSINHTNDQGLNLAVQSNGKLLVGGFTFLNNQSDILLMRLWP